MTIALSAELEARLTHEARQRGLDVSSYANQLLAKSLGMRDQATIDLIERWEAQDKTDDPEELARRQQELDEFKAAMNRNRLESDGPNARTPFP